MDEQSSPARWLARWLPWVCIVLYALVCLVFLTERSWRPEWDGAVYLLVGKALAMGEGYTYQGEPFFLRPSGLPWVLSFFVDEEGFDPYRVNLLMSFFAGAAVAAVYLAVRVVHGAWIGLGVALLTGSSPLFLQIFSWVLSEFPFAAFAFLGIALLQVSVKPDVRRWAWSKGSRSVPPPLPKSVKPDVRWWAWAVAGAVCLAIATYMRTVAVLILPGVFLVPLWHGRGLARLRGILPLLVSCALIAPWMAYSRSAAANVEVPVEQDLLHSYTTAMFHVDPGNPESPRVDLDGWVERIEVNGARLLEDLTRATLRVGAAGWLVPSLLIAAVLVGVAIAVVRRGPSLFEWFGLVYTVLILTYFANDPRLAMPLVPLVYLYLFTVCLAGGKWLAARARQPIVLPAVGGTLFVVLAIGAGVSAPRVLRVEGDLVAPYEKMARWIRENTPEDAVIMCNQAPVVALLSERLTYTFRFTRTRNILTKYDVDYVLLDGSAHPQFVQHLRSRLVESWDIDMGGGERRSICRVRK